MGGFCLGGTLLVVEEVEEEVEDDGEEEVGAVSEWRVSEWRSVEWWKSQNCDSSASCAAITQ